MTTPRERKAELDATVARITSRPILIDGDSTQLLELFRSGRDNFGIRTLNYKQLRTESLSQTLIVILLVDGHGRRSAFAKTTELLDKMRQVIANDAVRIAVIQSQRSRLTPKRLQNLLARELLVQVRIGLTGTSSRSFRQLVGAATLEAAGLRIVRFR